MHRLLILFLLLAPPAFAQQVPESQAQISLSFAPVVKRTAPAVVNIYATKVVKGRASPFSGDPFFERFFRGFGVPGLRRDRVQNSLGSGVIVSADGLVVSNHHVVGGANEIRVVLSDRREFDAVILISDAESDIAVIQMIDADGLPVLELADSDAAEVGDLVLAIGNPFGVGQTVTSGIVSGLARTSAGPRGGAGYFMQTDAPINPGNSGGALVDMAGRLIGVNTAILTRSGGSNGVGFAVPANLVRQVIAQAAEGRETFRRPWAGFAGQAVDAEVSETLGFSAPMGLLVKEIHPDSPFARAGLATGDVLTSLGGAPIGSEPELAFRMAALGIGADAAMAFLRDGARTEAAVTLIAAPETPARNETLIRVRSALAGVSVANLNPALAEELSLSPLKSGVVVTTVSGAARLTSFKPRDILRRVDGAEVASVADLIAALEAGQGRRFTVERGGRLGDIAFRN